MLYVVCTKPMRVLELSPAEADRLRRDRKLLVKFVFEQFPELRTVFKCTTKDIVLKPWRGNGQNIRK